MKIGIYQFNPEWGKINKNLAQIEKNLKSADKADLWILPELCTTGYQFTSMSELDDLAEEFPGGETSQRISKLSRKLETGIVIGVAEKYGDKYFNSAAVYEDGDYLGIYRKLHLFYEENKYFSPGDESPKVFEIKNAKVGVMICFDWIFPETVRSLTIRGSQLIAHPANLVLPYCQNAMVTRSIENKVFTATANRIGSENRTGEELTFTGMSQITNTKGGRLQQLSREKEETMIVEIKPGEATNKDLNEYNNLLGDRRRDLYTL